MTDYMFWGKFQTGGISHFVSSGSTAKDALVNLKGELRTNYPDQESWTLLGVAQGDKELGRYQGGKVLKLATSTVNLNPIHEQHKRSGNVEWLSFLRTAGLTEKLPYIQEATGLPTETIVEVNHYDPTGDRAVYTWWMCKLDAAKSLLHEDLDTIGELLRFFHDHKNKMSIKDINQAIDEIEIKVRSLDSQEVPSKKIGELLMRKLKKLKF